MEPNIKLCCFTVKPGGCHQEKSCPEFLSSESRSDVFGAGAQVWSRRVSDESFLAKLAYLRDIFGNEVNLQLQGKDKNLPQVTRSALSLESLQCGAGDSMKETQIHWRTCMNLLTLLTMMPPQWLHISSSIFHHWWDTFKRTSMKTVPSMTSSNWFQLCRAEPVHWRLTPHWDCSSHHRHWVDSGWV